MIRLARRKYRSRGQQPQRAAPCVPLCSPYPSPDSLPITVESHRVAELHPMKQVLMDVVLTNGETSPLEGKVCTQKCPSPPLAIDARHQWPLLYLLQLPAGEGWRQHIANSFPLLILSQIEGRLQDPVQTKVLHRNSKKGQGCTGRWVKVSSPLPHDKNAKKYPLWQAEVTSALPQPANNRNGNKSVRVINAISPRVHPG